VERVPSPPDLSPEATKELHRLIARLQAARSISRVDPQVVVTLARVSVLLDRAFRQVEADGVLVVAQNGVSYAHPLMKAVNSLAMRQKMLLQQLGLIDKGCGTAEPLSAEPIERVDDGRWAGLLRIDGATPGQGPGDD
jgi:hypothetical protein